MTAGGGLRGGGEPISLRSGEIGGTAHHSRKPCLVGEIG